MDQRKRAVAGRERIHCCRQFKPTVEQTSVVQLMNMATNGWESPTGNLCRSRRRQNHDTEEGENECN